MALQAIQIGPFKGGLNNISNSGESADTEVVDLVNMDVTMDGALTSRPPMARIANASSSILHAEILGIYRESPDAFYVIYQIATETAWVVRAARNGDHAQMTTIKSIPNSGAPSAWVNKVGGFVQVGDMGYFCADSIEGSSLTGFKWSPSVAAANVTGMPKGRCMVSFKSRLWITGSHSATNSSRMWFSTIDAGGIKVETWNTSVDYFDVAPGEGGFVTALVALNSSLLVFKNDGTWRFSYSSSPAKGSVDRISLSIGAANKDCVTELNNIIYTYDQGKVHELVNSTFSVLNEKVEFRDDAESYFIASGADLSTVGSRLILRYKSALYVYSADTRTWSLWRSTTVLPGKFIELPADSNAAELSRYRAPSRGTSDKKGNPIHAFYIQLEPEYTNGEFLETIHCRVRTKSYDFKSPSTYKRLLWWGIDHRSYGTFSSWLIPVTKRTRATWKQMRAFKWGQLSTETWGAPLKGQVIDTSIKDGSDVSQEVTVNNRLFTKFQRSLAFRQLAFQLEFNTDGKKTTGPVKLFGITAYVSDKHNVVDKNN